MMVFFWYCAIAPLTDKADAVLNGSSTPIVANFDMVRMKSVNPKCLHWKYSVQMESDLPGPWTVALHVEMGLEEVL